MIVSKFGGTSVADGEALTRLAGIVEARRAGGVLVVVSALAGVSDALIEAIHAAERADEARATALLAGIGARHRALLAEVGGGSEEAAVEDLLAGIEGLGRGVVLVRDATGWIRARFVGAGELLSSRIVAAALRERGIDAEWADARELVRTSGVDPERDPPVPEAIAERASVLGGDWAGRVVVTQGFIGSALVEGVERPTLLGRGGSDYSASLLGAALRASRVEIWTDVDGVLTAHPKVVPDARRVKLLSFAEASELAYFGAKVLHPATLLPAIEAAIPVWVGNARRPEGEGTTILPAGVRARDARFAVKAIADKRGITVVHVVSSRMLMAHGFLARIFAVFDAHRTPVDLIATSEVSVSLTIDDASRLPAIVGDLASFARVELQRGMALVCLVGEGMQGNGAVTAEALRVLTHRPVRLITQGASAINLSIVLPEEEISAAVRDLHDAFFRGPLPAEVFGEPATGKRADPGEGVLPGGGREALLAIAEREGTPAYVYDLDLIAARVARLREALPLSPGRLLYACKANAHPVVLRRLAAWGVGIEAASPGEAERAIACGHRPEDILLSATNARASDLGAIAALGCPLALGSIADVEKLGRSGTPARVLLRVNPGTGAGHHRHVVTGGSHSKFGIGLDELEAALSAARAAGLEVVGLHAHGGSGVDAPGPLLEAADALLAAARRLPRAAVVDFGGGFGIPYREGDAELDVESYGRGLAQRLDAFAAEAGARPEAWFEPGRFLVGPAGVLLARVTTRKESGGHVFVGLDTGMNHLLRPALYGAYHRILNLSAPDAPVERVEVVGNVCEASDVFASARLLPRAQEGDVLALLDAGAYGMSMASAYCLWPLPREVVVGAS